MIPFPGFPLTEAIRAAQRLGEAMQRVTVTMREAGANLDRLYEFARRTEELAAVPGQVECYGPGHDTLAILAGRPCPFCRAVV